MSSPANPAAILDTIDNAISDYEMSADAMRWTPDPPRATGGHVPAAPDIARLFDIPPGFLRLRPAFVMEPWQAEALRRMGQHVEAAMAGLGGHLGKVLKGARLTYGLIDEVYWDRCRRPERVTRIRRAYRAKRRGW